MLIKLDSLSPQHNDHYTSNEFSATRIQTATKYGTCCIAQHSYRNEGKKVDIPSDAISLCHKNNVSNTKSIVPKTIADNIPTDMLLNNHHDTSFSSTTTSMQSNKHHSTNLNSPFKKQSNLHRTNSFSTNKNYLEQQKKLKKKCIPNESLCFSDICDGPSSNKHQNNPTTNQTPTTTSNNETRLTIKISKLKDGLRTISFNNNNATYNQASDENDVCNKDTGDSNDDGGVGDDDGGGDDNDGGQTDSDETEEEVYVGDLFIHNGNHNNITQSSNVQNLSTQNNQQKDNANAIMTAINHTIPTDSSSFSHSSISNSVIKHASKNKQTNNCTKSRPIKSNKSNNKSKYKGTPKARSQKTRSVSVNTEDDLLGVCEAGTVVRMPGYVWTDSAQNGMLLFKTVWKNKRYEGMLVQASHDDWSFPKSRVFTSCPGSRYKRRCKKPKEFSYVDNCKKRSRNIKSKNRALRNLLGLDEFSSCGNSSDEMALQEPEGYLSCSESGCEKKFACVLARQFHYDQCHAVYDDYVLERRKKEKDEDDEEEDFGGDDDRLDINGVICEKMNKKRMNEGMAEANDGMYKKGDSMLMKKLKLSNSNSDFGTNDNSNSSSGESSNTAKSSLFATSLNPTLMLIRRHKNNCYDDLQTTNPPSACPSIDNSSNYPLSVPCTHSSTLPQDSTLFSHSIASSSINPSIASITLSSSSNLSITQSSSIDLSVSSVVPPICTSPFKKSTTKTSQASKSKQATTSTKSSISSLQPSSSSSLLSSSSSSASPLVASSIVYQLLSNNYTSLHSQKSSVQLSSSLSSSPSLMSPSFPHNTEASTSTSNNNKNNISTKTVETQQHNTPLLSSFTDSQPQHLSSHLNKQQVIKNIQSSFLDSPLPLLSTQQASSSSTNQTQSSATNQMPASSSNLVTASSSNQECSLSNKTSSSSSLPSIKAASSPLSSAKSSSSSSSLSLMIDEGVKSPSQQTIRNADDTPTSQDDVTPAIEDVISSGDKEPNMVCDDHQDSSTDVMKVDSSKEVEKEEGDVKKNEGGVEEKKKEGKGEKGDGEVLREGASPVYSDISDAVEDAWQAREGADEENRVADWLHQSDNMQYTSYFQQIILNKHFTPYKQSPPNHSILPPENPS